MSSVSARRSSIVALPKADLLPALALAALALFFFYVFRPVELSDNSLGYISRVLDADFFYAPHLLHAAIIMWFHTILSTLTTCDITCAGMAHSMMWAAITIASVYMVARRVLATTGGAVLTALGVLVAHGFWVFATQLEVYVPSVGAVAAATAILLTNRSPTLSPFRVIAVSILWATATMYHVANVFLFIPFCVYFYSTQGLRGWRQLSVISALAGGPVLAIYVTVYVFAQEAWSFQGFFEWVLALTDVPMTPWGSVSHWQPAALFSAGWRQIITLTLLPEYLTYDQRPLWVIGALVVGAALLWNVLQVARSDSAAVTPRWVRLYFLALFGTNFLLFAWWQPLVHKFYIPSSIPLIVLIALAARDVYLRAATTAGRRVVVAGSAAAVAVMFTFNLSSVLELRRSLGPDHAEAAVLNRLAPPQCTIYSVGHHLNPLRVYFGRQAVVSTRGFLTAFHDSVTGDNAPWAATRAGEEMEEECALIPLGFLSREFYETVAGEYLGMDRWPDYVGYFFDVNEDVGTAGITHSAFEFVAEGDGPPHVLVDRTRRVQAPGVTALAGMLQAEVDDAMQKYRAEWPTWHGRAPNLAFIPRANVEIGRYRKQIFGYSFGDQGRQIGRDGEGSAR